MQVNELEKNLPAAFFKYVTANVLGMLGLSCYILADTFFIAQGVGSDGLAALNLVLPVYSLISGIGLMLGMGGATAFSIARGEADAKTDSRSSGLRFFSQTLIWGLVASAVFTSIGLLFAEPLTRLLGADRQILPLASQYLKTILLFSGAFLFNNIFLCFVRNDGNPALPMAAMLVGSGSNVVLDYVFIIEWHMGMFGAAFATGIAPLISIAILSLQLKRRDRGLRLISAAPCKKDSMRILSLGLPSFVTEFSSGIIMLLFNFTILALAGNTGVAAYGIIANLALIVIAIFTGTAQGVQPLFSSCCGRRDTASAKKLLSMALALAGLLGALFWLLGAVYPSQITALFNSTGDPLLAENAVRGIRLYFPAFLPAGLNIILISYLAATAQPKVSFALSLLRGFGAVVPAVLLLPQLLAMDGVWLSIPAAELLTLGAAAWFMFRFRE